MKGVFFQKPLEFSIEAFGESWSQGDTLKGSLNIKSHNPSIEIEYSKVGIHLCLINLKKYKAKDLKAIQVLASKTAISAETEFNFQLEQNCHITEKASSLYLICGDIESPFEAGLLELNIIPAKSILDFKELFENFFKFSLKPFKNKLDKKLGNYIETKVTPPNSPEWTPVLGMNIRTRTFRDEFELIFSFKLKTMSYDLDNIGTKDSKKEIKKFLSKKEYLSFGDNLNQDFFRKLITEVLDEVKLKSLI
jgi:hypothetical protein